LAGIDSEAGFDLRTRTGFPQAASSFACATTNSSICRSETLFLILFFVLIGPTL
jgi:hypothetical protein